MGVGLVHKSVRSYIYINILPIILILKKNYTMISYVLHVM